MSGLQTIVDVLLWAAVLSTGVKAGVYFAFSTFIMGALAALDRPQGMLAMRSINRVILRSPFMPLFFGSSLICLPLVATGLLNLSDPGALAMASGGMIYLVGMLVVTMVGNVPLNQALDAADPDAATGDAAWARYLRRWVPWNHVRTVASTLACTLFVAAIAQRS